MDGKETEVEKEKKQRGEWNKTQTRLAVTDIIRVCGGKKAARSRHLDRSIHQILRSMSSTCQEGRGHKNVIFCFDFTERKEKRQTKKAYRQSKCKQNDTYLSISSHALKTPDLKLQISGRKKREKTSNKQNVDNLKSSELQ